MQIAINRAHFPVTVLGPGRRIGLWLQGCSIRCKACVSRDTWAKDSGRNMPLATLLTWCQKVSNHQLDGVTISGGEPFDQAPALAALLKGLHGWRQDRALDFDILCYSGYPLATLQKRHGKLLGLLDALIPEPYADALPEGLLWRGSLNQDLLPLSARGEARYRDFIAAKADPQGRRWQTQLDGDRLWAIGIPARGDMAALQEKCAERGVQFMQNSWRS